MSRKLVPSFTAAALVAAGVLNMLLPSMSAAAGESAEQRCRRAIAGGLFTSTSKILKARARCQEYIILGFLGPNANCASGAPTIEIARALRDSNASLRSQLEAACSDANWGLLSYPGPCASMISGIFDAEKLLSCMTAIRGQVTNEIFPVWYPANLYGARGSAASCMRSIPKRAASMLLREARLRLRCLVEQELDEISASTDCRGLLPPYGAGTGSAELDDGLARSQDFRFPSSCWKADFLSLGYDDDCPSLVAGTGYVDLQRCVRRAHRLTVPVLLDVAFPTAAVCGNRIPQEAEECDDGAGNSNTNPDACRLDCKLPICGDHVTDPTNGESCDDGNSADLDGCAPGCVAEVCGDGEINNLPDESCDDGNTNAADRCTNDCRDASCGDGILCTDATCTSGPGGGLEQCDKGTANSETGLCKPDCSGFTRSCTLTVGVTNSVTLGAITYQLHYRDVPGEMLGSGAKVDCKSTVTGGLVSFFDNDTTRIVKESLIVNAGVQAPASLATCTFATNAASLAAGAFTFTIDVAADPDFNPVPATLAVTSIACTSQ